MNELILNFVPSSYCDLTVRLQTEEGGSLPCETQYDNKCYAHSDGKLDTPTGCVRVIPDRRIKSKFFMVGLIKEHPKTELYSRKCCAKSGQVSASKHEFYIAMLWQRSA
uniref:Uncharacterized protein n=1 Tax=Schistocephalus solidus TaxID=70667 RepID=A0A0V0J6C6_SCHSO